MKQISFEPIMKDTISKVITDPTHTVAARTLAVKKNVERLAAVDKKKVPSPVKVPEKEKKVPTPEKDVEKEKKVPNPLKKPTKRKQITGPALAFPSENLFDPPDLRRKIIRKPRTTKDDTASKA